MADCLRVVLESYLLAAVLLLEPFDLLPRLQHVMVQPMLLYITQQSLRKKTSRHHKQPDAKEKPTGAESTYIEDLRAGPMKGT